MIHQAQVFVSCGQHTEEEDRIACEIERLPASKGFRPWVAKKVQTLLDINGDIIDALKASDYYLFIKYELFAKWTNKPANEMRLALTVQPTDRRTHKRPGGWAF